MDDAVNCQHKHQPGGDPGGVRHQRFGGLFDGDADEGPDQHEDVAAVSAGEGHEQTDDAGNDQHDDRPNLRSDAEPVPVDEVQQVGDVGDGRDGDPAEVNAEGYIDRPLLSGVDRGPPDIQPQVGGDQQPEQGQHHQHAPSKGVVMPADQPQGVEDAAEREGVAQPAQARTFLLPGAKLVNGEGDPADVDHTPDGKDVTGRDEVHEEAV